RPVMLLAESACGVASRLESLGYGHFIQVQPLGAGRYAAHAASRVIAAGEVLSPSRRAHGTDIKTLEQRAVMRQRVDMRRRKIRVAADAQVAPTLVVRQNDDNIQPRPGMPLGTRLSTSGSRRRRP